jgi:hypothetical protein
MSPRRRFPVGGTAAPKGPPIGGAMQQIVLEISQSVLPDWRRLPHCVRWHVGAFPRVSASPEAYGTHRFSRSLTERATSSAQGDVAEVANRLATAFPQLVRRVTAVAVDGPITVRLECVGLHEGMWGDTICPTKRRVAFEEQHEIIAVEGRVVSDQIMLDVGGILLQLCGSSRIDPDETVRMGKARREFHERARLAARQARREIPQS